MPYANEEDRREHSRKRYEKRKADPEAMEIHRAKQRAMYRRKMEDPEFREKKREVSALQRTRQPERVKKTHRESKRRTLYGIEPHEFDRMLAEQGGACAVCRRERRLVVDHDHETGAVRGLLCDSCNQGLGKFADDTERLNAAIAYLRKIGAA